jgi:orotate phosphoribosyltransferase
MHYNKSELKRLFLERALKFGDFTLASGRKAKYFLDGKQVTLFSTGLKLVSLGLLELTQDLNYQAIGGLTIGADPIVSGMLALADSHKNLTGCLVRKETKDHGTKKLIEGPLVPGQKVLVVEDVVTTGGSAFKAVEQIREYGCEVVACVGIVDRMEGGREFFASKNIPFRTLITIEDFGITPPTDI